MLCVASTTDAAHRHRPPHRSAGGKNEICGAGGGEESRTPCVFTRLSGSPSQTGRPQSHRRRGNPCPLMRARKRPPRRDEPGASAVWVRRPAASASEVGLGSPPSTPPRTLHSSPYALLGGKGGGGGGGHEHATQRVQLSSQHRSDMQNDTAYTRHKSRTPHDSRLRSGCDARRYASPCVYRLVH